MIETLRYILLLARLAVVQHEAEAVALVSRTLLGAVGDVAAIGGIERRGVAGGIVGGDVLGFGQNLSGRVARSHTDRDDPEIVVGGSGRILVVIRGVANLLSIGRESIVVLPAEREHGRIVVARGQIAGCARGTAGGGCPHTGIYGYDKNVTALACLVCIPVPIEQTIEDQRLDLRLLRRFKFLRVAGSLVGGR